MNNKNIEIAAKMSKRLITIAEMLRASDVTTACDVGCDHGYISIYLVQSGIAEKAIAMDVRKGPLSGALDNVREYGLTDFIETRLSDGLKELSSGEADTAVIAGMGGKLMMSILEDGDPVRLGIKQAILQPQSDILEFRSYLRLKGYTIAAETVLLDEGKFYFPMRVVFGQESLLADKNGRIHDYLFEAMTILMEKTSCDEETARNICDRFGEHNILHRDEILKSYLLHGKEVSLSILENLKDKGYAERTKELEKELFEIDAVLSLY